MLPVRTGMSMCQFVGVRRLAAVDNGEIILSYEKTDMSCGKDE